LTSLQKQQQEKFLSQADLVVSHRPYLSVLEMPHDDQALYKFTFSFLSLLILLGDRPDHKCSASWLV